MTMTIEEQERLFAECLGLPRDEHYSFLKAHGLENETGAFWVYARAHRGKRGKKQERKAVIKTQGSICALCGEKTVYNKLRLDPSTGRTLCVSHQILLAHVRKALTNGITLDRLADYLQIIPPTAPVDPFSPDSPDADV